MKMKLGPGLCALAIFAVPAPGLAQKNENAGQKVQQFEAARNAETPDDTCEKSRKKKKGIGLGGVLRSARSSGLLGAVAGRAGADGYLVGSAANAAIDISAAEAQQRDAQPARETQSC